MQCSIATLASDNRDDALFNSKFQVQVFHWLLVRIPRDDSGRRVKLIGTLSCARASGAAGATHIPSVHTSGPEMPVAQLPGALCCSPHIPGLATPRLKVQVLRVEFRLGWNAQGALCLMEWVGCQWPKPEVPSPCLNLPVSESHRETH